MEDTVQMQMQNRQNSVLHLRCTLHNEITSDLIGSTTGACDYDSPSVKLTFMFCLILNDYFVKVLDN